MHGLKSLASFVLLATVTAAPTTPIQSRDLRGHRLQILPLGDSITFGYGSSTGNAWRLNLLTALQGLGSDAVMVGTQRSGNFADNFNEGYPGYTIDQIAAKAPNGYPFQPNVVLLHAGTNDCGGNIDVANAHLRLGNLIDQLVAALPRATIIVAKIIASRDPAIQARIDAFNSKVTGVVYARYQQGKHVGITDMSTALGYNDLADPVHPNDVGYQKMANLWLEALKICNNWGWI